ncbi:DUF4450 domain-containing protein [Hymenobacter gummosus]|uniref:DUF4450 domain-containing protein n=1 Tax=Hymenobacter gummosus TaxID=1776032 RepID=UPI001A9DD771|nr:DUF4450 domain-containing protein [Hymenobacter gummosus]
MVDPQRAYAFPTFSLFRRLARWCGGPGRAGLGGALGLLALLALPAAAQQAAPLAAAAPLWHQQARTLRYRPEGQDFVIQNGTHRFTRALYGTNTAFRVEAGDLPEFALYLPGMGGNLKLGLVAAGAQSKWLSQAARIEARYRPGAMLYTIEDPLLGPRGRLRLTLLALADAEGLVLKAEFDHVAPNAVQLAWAFGGASGRKFSRDGDIGADPESSFDLKPEYCQGNEYALQRNAFTLTYGQPPKNAPAGTPRPRLLGLVPPAAVLRVADAARQQTPAQLLAAPAAAAPVLAGRLPAKAGETLYFAVQKAAEAGLNAADKTAPALRYADLPAAFQRAEAARQQLAGRVLVSTPDAYLNTLGGALSVAADAIWEAPSYMHGAVAWRMRLNGWRGPYAADPLGWHDRARTHFRSYAQSQLTQPEIGPVVMDTALNLARSQEKLGTSVYSRGYISRNPGGDQRAHHYDMNLVFIDELLRHLRWTGDLAFAREMWPVLTRHLAWEKRNFDPDGDGLYDAYAAIWASDALQYSGGAVTHSSAYNYFSNHMAAELAALIGQDAAPYRQEARKIRQALNARLWLPRQGSYAEYQDALGRRALHASAGLWTIYHALDSEVADPQQAYQATRYVDAQLPHIPVRAQGLPDEGYYLLSTTNWQPYDWSINNVALAENLHATLAYWQAGRADEAFRLWKSALLESMYLGSSPGNFQQISFYDAHRGELYRDFADPIGVAARSLVEGLFGLRPDALHDTLLVKPGLPSAWDSARLVVPDVTFRFQRQGQLETYQLTQRLPKRLALKLQVPALATEVAAVTVNGQPAAWRNVAAAVGRPLIEISSAPAERYVVDITWRGEAPDRVALEDSYRPRKWLYVELPRAKLLTLRDPQRVLTDSMRLDDASVLNRRLGEETGGRTVFAQLRQGALTWWEPLPLNVKPFLEVVDYATPPDGSVQLRIRLNESRSIPTRVDTNGWGAPPPDSLRRTLPDSLRRTLGILSIERIYWRQDYHLPLGSSVSRRLTVPAAALVPGRNAAQIGYDFKVSPVPVELTTWSRPADATTKWERIDLTRHFNDQVTSIFQPNKYLAPRPKGPTLQLPTQGIGNWCYPLTQANIDDAGLRQLAGTRGEIQLPIGIPLRTPGAAGVNNVLFVSQWDNYPEQATVPLKGRASHAYLLMAGSTNPMQSQLDNGEVLVQYTDGTTARLALRNPDSWWPIEQDYLDDGFAFRTGAVHPLRVHLKTGRVVPGGEFDQYTSIKGFSTRTIDGGAATVLDLPLDPKKKLKSLTVRALANDVVIGLMSVTLARP